MVIVSLHILVESSGSSLLHIIEHLVNVQFIPLIVWLLNYLSTVHLNLAGLVFRKQLFVLLLQIGFQILIDW